MIDYETALLIQKLYMGLLLVTGAFVAVRVAETGNLALMVCAAAVIADWSACTFYVLASDNEDATACFLLADTLALAIILLASWKLAAGQLLASSYVGQIIANSQHGLSDDDALRNWMLLTLIAFGQLFLLAIWAAIPTERDAGRESG